MRKLGLNIFLLSAGFLFIWIGCSRNQAKGTEPGNDKDTTVTVRPVVIFATADSLPLYHYVESQGIVKANRQIKLQAKISGFVQKSNIKTGRWVHKGDTLFTFQRQKWQYAVLGAQNQYQKALAAYHIQKGLRQADGSSDGTKDAISPKVDRMIRISTGLAKAEVALSQAKLNLSHTTITAPFSGYLATDQRTTAGAFVPAGTKLGKLVDVSTVRVRFNVLENELHIIHKGMKVDITSPAGQALNGTIAAIAPVVDTQSKVGTVVARVGNRSRILYPGMIVSGRILVQKVTGKARIPRSAILTRHGRQLVFKLNSATNEVEWIYVHPVSENNNWAIVNNPKIAPGDTLAVDNNFSLSHLEKVQPKMQLLQRADTTAE